MHGLHQMRAKAPFLRCARDATSVAYAPAVRRFVPLALLVALGFAPSCTLKSSGPHETTQAAEVPLDDFVLAKLDEAAIPGVAAAIVKHGRVVFTHAWGWADLEHHVPASDASIWVLGSVSKTITGTATMQMVEAKKLDLDADVNGYLPFAVRNPKWPDVPITLRMLMTHTSSIQESAARLVSLAKPGDPAVDLRGLLEPYLVPGGATYVEGESYGAQKPGTKFVYSNFGAALAALMVERAAGEPFHQYCKHHIFEPLGLSSTSFRLDELDASRLAVAYTYVEGKGQEPNPQTSVPYYPSTTLRTTAPDLARLLATIARGGEIDGVRLLQVSTVDEMLKEQVPADDPGNDIFAQGLLWEHRPIPAPDAEVHCVGHGGSYYGASTRMHMTFDEHVGVITLANGDVHLRVSAMHDDYVAAYRAIESRLFREAEKY